MAWLPLLLLAALGTSAQPTLPIWLSGVSERFHLAPLQSGLIGSLELGCVALASMVWAATSRSGRGVAWLYAALLLGMVGNLAAFKSGSVAQLVVARSLVGLSYGVTLAEITRRAALTPNPHRVFSMQQLALVAFVTIYFATVQTVISSYGPFSPFLYGATLGLLSLLSLSWISVPVTTGNPAEQPASAGARGGTGAIIGMALVALMLAFVAQGSIWPYITDAGRSSNVRAEVLGNVLAAGAVCNLVAPILAERVGLRFGRTAPLVVGHVGVGAGILMVSLGLDPIWFTAGSVALNLFLLFLMPFMLGILAALDASGRSASMAPAFYIAGGAIGPALGGFVIGKVGMVLLGVLLAVVVGVALAMMLTASRRITAVQRG